MNCQGEKFLRTSLIEMKDLKPLILAMPVILVFKFFSIYISKCQPQHLTLGFDELSIDYNLFFLHTKLKLIERKRSLRNRIQIRMSGSLLIKLLENMAWE